MLKELKQIAERLICRSHLMLAKGRHQTRRRGDEGAKHAVL
jgi:hypothetical protein